MLAYDSLQLFELSDLNYWESIKMAIYRYLVKALLHYAIFSATCHAMAENLALQVAEVWC